MNKAKVIRTENADFPYNVQIFTECNGEYFYTGTGKYCRNEEEVKEMLEKFNVI